VKGDRWGTSSPSGLVVRRGIGGTIGVILWAWCRNTQPGPGSTSRSRLAIGYAIGRAAASSPRPADYGRPGEGPWAMSYPDGTKTSDNARPSDPGLRTPLWGRVALRSGRSATASTKDSYFALYAHGGERASWRGHPPQLDVALGLTKDQLVRVAMMIAGEGLAGPSLRRVKPRAGLSISL